MLKYVSSHYRDVTQIGNLHVRANHLEEKISAVVVYNREIL